MYTAETIMLGIKLIRGKIKTLSGHFPCKILKLTVSWDCIGFSQFINDSGPELVIIRLYRKIFGILGNKTSPVYRTSWTNRKCCHVMKIKGWQTLVNFKCCHFADRINTRQAFSNLRMNTKKICSTRLGIFFTKECCITTYHGW